MTKTGLQSHLLRNSALALVLGVGLVGCSDGSDSYFGWGDPGAWYESGSPGEGDPNLEGARVPGDRLPEAQQASRGPGLEMGSTDEGVAYADNDVRGSDSGTQSGSQSMASAPAPAPVQEPSPLIAGARNLGEMPPAPAMEPDEEKADAAGTMEVASTVPETKKSYTPIPGTRTLSGMRPKGSMARSTAPMKDAEGNIIEVARLMDRGNPDIPGPMPFAGNDGTVRGYPTQVDPAPSDLGEPVDVRTAEVKEPPAPGASDMPSVLPSGSGAPTATADASAGSSPSSSDGGPRSIGQYLNGDGGGDAPMRAAPLASSEGRAPSALANSVARPPLVPIASGEDETTLEASMAGSFDQDYNAVSGGTLSESVVVDMTALDERQASVPQELLAELNSEFGGGDPSYGYTHSDLQFDVAPMAAPTGAVVQRQETLASLIPADRSGAKPSGAYIPFALGSVRLSAQDRAAITKLANMVSGTNKVVHIIGHAADPSTDTHGGVRGFELSLERANKVAAALVAAGVPHNQVRVEARGVTGARRADLYIR